MSNKSQLSCKITGRREVDLKNFEEKGLVIPADFGYHSDFQGFKIIGENKRNQKYRIAGSRRKRQDITGRGNPA